jgi:hypothetical protein
MGTASGPAGGSLAVTTESADDFVTSSTTRIHSAAFTGLLAGGAAITDLAFVGVEIYRVFPLDSTSPPSGNLPTRTNSPSDVAFDSRNPTAGTLTFAVTGIDVEFDVTFTTPFRLPADHYFFVPEAGLSSGRFLWLSAPKPIVAPGTPFALDLQSWIRNDNLAPDWLRIVTDVVGGTPAPTFNAAFSLTDETAATIPEPGSLALLLAGVMAALASYRLKRSPGGQRAAGVQRMLPVWPSE